MAHCRLKKRRMDTVHHSGCVSAMQSGLVLRTIDLRHGDHMKVSEGTFDSPAD